MKTIVIIPARMAAERLLGKPLMKMKGRSIIYLCYYNALLSAADKVFVASPDPEILWEVCKGGGNSIETSGLPINGTERVAEAARTLQLAPDDIVVNLQGDMPFFDPEIIDTPIRLLKAMNCNVTSVMRMLLKKDHNNLNRVKVNIDEKGRAVSFSREYIECSYLHIGVYVFRNSFLQRYDKYGLVAEERSQGLEQLRTMHMKEPIWMSFVESRPVVIDCKEDLIDAQK